MSFDSRASRRAMGWAAIAVVGVLAVAAIDSVAQDERDRPRPQRADRPEPELTNEEVETLIELVSEGQPAMGDRLRQLRESDPEQFRQTMLRLTEDRRLRPMIQMRRHDPKGFEISAEARRARVNAGRIRRELMRAEGDRAESLQEELRNAARTMIDAEIRLREHELTQLEKRLEQLQADLAHRRENRDALVEQYVQRMTHGARRDGGSADTP